jgi:hypothetical protein
METIQPVPHERMISTDNHPSMSKESRADVVDLEQEPAMIESSNKKPRITSETAETSSTTATTVDHPCTNMACQRKAQELHQEITRLKRIVASSPSMAKAYTTGVLPTTPGGGSVDSSSALVTPTSGARAPPSTPATAKALTPVPATPVVVDESRVVHKRDTIARAIYKDLVWKQACTRKSGAKWKWEGDCTFPELVRILKLPDNTKQFGMKRIPVADFQAAVGPIKSKKIPHGFGTIGLTGENVIVHFAYDTVKITGTYGEVGEKKSAWYCG